MTITKDQLRVLRHAIGRAGGGHVAVSSGAALRPMCAIRAHRHFTVAHGPYVPPGDWMLPWVRNELALWFRRPASLALADPQGGCAAYPPLTHSKT